MDLVGLDDPADHFDNIQNQTSVVESQQLVVLMKDLPSYVSSDELEKQTPTRLIGWAYSLNENGVGTLPMAKSFRSATEFQFGWAIKTFDAIEEPAWLSIDPYWTEYDSWRQWAALAKALDEIIEPPQKWFPSDFEN